MGLIATMLGATTTSPAGAQPRCAVVDTFEVTNGSGSPVSSLGRVFVTASGAPSVAVDLAGRRIARSTTFHVNAAAAPGGNGSTPATAFDDIDTAIAAINAGATVRATLLVAPGVYTWGDIGVPDFAMNVIGAGIGRTIVRHAAGNATAAQVRLRDVYIEGISFEGGATVLDLRNMANATVVDSEFSGSTTRNGVAIYNVTTAIVSGSRAHHNHADGFGYHNPLRPMEVLEIFSNGSDNGQNGSWNSQGSTIHDTVKIVRVGGTYGRNPTNISDVGSGESWNIGITTAGARANDQGGEFLNYNISGSVRGWIVAGSHHAGPNSPTVVHSRRSAQLRYVSRFGTLAGATITGNAAVVDDSPLVPFTCAPDPEPDLPLGTTCPATMSLGRLQSGINATDRATGSGYLMWSRQNVHRRFATPKPAANNSNNLIAVVRRGNEWLYDNGRVLTAFTPASSDCLLAELDFSTDTATLLRGTDTTIHGIDAGYTAGNLAITPNWWNGAADLGEWTATGTQVTKS
jgi:hypothetical protein